MLVRPIQAHPPLPNPRCRTDNDLLEDHSATLVWRSVWEAYNATLAMGPAAYKVMCGGPPVVCSVEVDCAPAVGRWCGSVPSWALNLLAIAATATTTTPHRNPSHTGEGGGSNCPPPGAFTYDHRMPPGGRTRTTHVAGRRAATTPPPAPVPAPEPAPEPAPVPARTEPQWWVRDIVIVIAVGALLAAATTAVQWKIDDDRADRELRAANLTFVRDKSSPDADVPRPFNGIDLIGQNLAGLDLQKAALTASDLSHSNLEVTDLQDATLRDADLSDVDASGVNLSGADITDGNLAGADLSASRLVGTTLYGANLAGADLSNADLRGADLRGANLSGANLDDADLTDVNLAVDGLVDPGRTYQGASLSDPQRLVDRSNEEADVCWSDTTRWDDNFIPPSSNADSCEN